MERFSEVKEINRSDVTVRPDLFQGRESDYSQATVDSIVNKGYYERNRDPIIVWYDNDTDKYIVISGHSRWKATEILYEQGQKSLETIPVKEYLGDLEEAIEYATMWSNREGDPEGLKPDISVMRNLLAQGKNRRAMLDVFKKDSYVDRLKKYTYLNPDGLFLHYLTQEAAIHISNLERSAMWAGELRKEFPDKLTDAHETEMFHYMTEKGQSLIKHKFFDTVRSKVNKVDFNKDLPLNLKNYVSTSAVTDPVKSRIDELLEDVAYFKKGISDREKLIARASISGQDELAEKFKSDIASYQKRIYDLVIEVQRLEDKMEDLKNKTTVDLFSDFGSEDQVQEEEPKLDKKEFARKRLNGLKISRKSIKDSKKLAIIDKRIKGLEIVLK